VYAPLAIQHAVPVLHIIIFGLTGCTIFFPHYLISGTIFEKKVIEHKVCVLIFSTTLSETFIILRRSGRDMIKMFIVLHAKLFL
jgi:hypothetical protein